MSQSGRRGRRTGPEGPQRSDLVDDIAAALDASPAAAAFFER
jgi:hypothetical protein